MISVKEYRPNFVDSNVPLRVEEVENVNDILNISWLKDRNLEIAEWVVRTKEHWVVATLYKDGKPLNS